MPIRVEWLKDNRVAVFTASSPLTVADIANVFNDFASACEKLSVPVHTIHDTLAVSNIPDNVLSLLRSRRSVINHRMAGSFIIVARSAFMKSIINMMTRLFPWRQIYMVSTVQAAWQKVEELLAAESTVEQ
jgi:hypothetical protein